MRSRRLSTTLFLAGVIMALGSVFAWACTNLATLNLSSSQVGAGETIDVSGSSFATEARGGQAVEFHWDAVDGPVLATATPDATGAIAASIAIPGDAQPGYHVLIATQNVVSDEGEVSAAYGTPARASVLIGNVNAADAATQPSAADAAPATVATEPASTGLIAATALLALLGIGLFGAGLGLFVREVRRRGAVPAPAERDNRQA